MATINIVHVTSSLRIGGAETVLYHLVKELQHAGFQQTVVYVHGGPFVDRLHALGIKTIMIQGWLYRYDPLFFIRLYRVLRDRRPTVIHSLLWAANVATRLCAWLLNIPVVCAYHNNVDQDGLIRSWCDRLTIRCATRLIAVSDQVADAVRRRSRLQHQQITVIPNGIKTDMFQAIEPIAREQLGIAPNAYVIGAVGRFEPVKRFGHLIRAYANMSDSLQRCLVLVGVGSEEQRLRTMARTMTRHPVLFVTHQSALPYYALFDCFVQPSHKEGISLALLEAMLSHKPCIVMAADATRYHPVIKHDKNGLMVPSDDIDALVAAMHKLHAHRSYAHTLGMRAHDTICTQFDMGKMIHKYKKTFKDIIIQNTK